MKAAIVPSATTLRFEWITDSQRFLALREQWNLLGSSAIETIFLTHAWLATWLEQLAPDAELHVLTAWEGDRLVAALPLFGSPEAGRGRRWAIMGTGTLTPNHLDIIAEPAFREQAQAGFVRLLLGESANWDVLDFDKLPADTDTAETLKAAFAATGLPTSCSVSAVCVFCDLPPTYQAYLASRSKATRKKIRETQRWLEKQPATRRLALCDSEQTALRALDSLERLHQARWEAKGYPGVFADPRVVRFHETVVRAAMAAGSMRMYTLTDGDEIMAVSYDCRTGSTVQGYLSTFDARWAQSSPGVLLRAYVIEQSIAEGATRFDYLEGGEQYKKAWCTGERENLRLRVFNRTLAGRAGRMKSASEKAIIRLARRWVPQKLRERVVRAIARRKTPPTAA